MEFTYDIITAKSDKKAAIGIYICHIIDNLIELFLSTFLIAHIHAYSTDIFDYLIKVSIYELVGWITMLLVYLIVSKIVDGSNRVGVYRFSMVLWAVFVIFTIFYGNEIANLLWLAGIMLGIAKGFYWSSYNVLKQEMVGKSSMGKFATYTRVYQQLVSVLFPITLGAIIDIASFSNAAIVVLVFCVIQIAVSFLIGSKHPTNARFDLKGYIKGLKQDTPLAKRLRFIYGISAVFAANNVMSTLIYVYIMILYGSNFSLGIITSLISVAVIIATLLVGKFTKEGRRGALYITSAIIPILSAILFVLMPIKSTLVIFNFAISVCGVVFKLIFDIYRNKFLKEYGRYDDIAEHQCVLETILQFVRAVVSGILILVALTKSLLAVQILIVVFTIIYSLNLILLMIFEKKFMTETPTIQKAD